MKALLKNKKGGVFDSVAGIFIGLTVLAIVAVVVFLILSELASNTTVAADGNASQAVADMQSSGEDTVGWVPIVVIVLIGALLIGLVALFRRSS